MSRVDEVTRRRHTGRKARAARARADAARETRPTPRQLDYLRAIHWLRGRPLVGLAAHLEVGVHAAGEMVRRLEREGWVEPVPGPRRMKVVQLTGSGVMACLLAATRAFADELRDQGVHVGMGTPPVCIVCRVDWPCATASPPPDPPCLADAADAAIGD